MAQTGYTPISLYYTTTAAATPLAANLTSGELAINITDGKLFYKDNGGTVQVLATKGGVGSATNTQVLYNSSGLVVGSANLTFNGTTLTAAGLAGPLNGTVGATTPNTGAFTTLTTTGDTGIGVSPSAWVGFRALQVGGTTSIWSTTSGNGSSFYSNNLYYNGANRIYLTTGFATEYIQDSSAGAHIWYTAPSGTAGGTVTTTERLRLTSTGLAVTGTLSASGNSILGTSANATVNVGGGGFTQAGYGLVAVNGTSGGMVKFGVSTAAAGQIYGNAGGIAIDTLANATNIDHYINTSLVTRTSSTGLAVTGAIGINALGSNARLDISGTTVPGIAYIRTGASGANSLLISDGNASGTKYGVVGNTTTADTWALGYTASAGTLFTPVATWSSTGLAVTGTLSASGTLSLTGSNNNFIRDDSTLVFNSTGASGGTNRSCINGTSTDQLLIKIGSALSTVGTFSSTGLAVTGTLSCTGALSKGSGSFRITHPLPELSGTHQLVHSFIEGPKADLIYRGKVDLINGTATVNIDAAAGMTDGTFVVLCRDVQCFTTNESDWTPVRGSVAGNVLTIQAEDSSSTASVSWMVIGERQDRHMYDTDWTDDEGHVIVEPLKPVVETPVEAA